MKPKRAWVLLKSGRRLDLLDPHPHAWTDEDLATGLSRTYRWGGHSRWELPLSVAQHSLTVLHIRLTQAGRPLSPAEQLRELAHDMDEGLLGYDAITPLKPQLGEGYQCVVRRLRHAINSRYDLPSWDRQSSEAHKQADRLAAASEARHVIGWSAADIRFSLGIAIDPLPDDPVPTPPGLRPWEPWPSRLAARMFLERLYALQRDVGDLAEGSAIIALDPGCPPVATRHQPADRPIFVVVESGDGQQVIEGQVVKGVRDEDGAWDFDGVFTVQTEEGELIKVNGWCCLTEIQ